MTYPCPVGCDKEFEKRTHQMNHIRMKDDEAHNQMHQRLNELGTPVDDIDSENSDDTVNDENDNPELSESFEEKYSGGDSDEVDDHSDEVLEFDNVDDSDDSEGPEGYRSLDEDHPLEKELADEFSWIEKGDKPIQDKEVKR